MMCWFSDKPLREGGTYTIKHTTRSARARVQKLHYLLDVNSLRRDEERGELGVIDEIIVTGANDVWVVRGGPLGEVLIPVIDDCVLEVDTETRTARVRLLPGLIEEA